jgi:hypothetical protein
MFVVLKAYPWTALETVTGIGVRMVEGAGMPSKWLPVFDTREDAKAWGAEDWEILAMTQRSAQAEGKKP